jgi:hypothetical protein
LGNKTKEIKKKNRIMINVIFYGFSDDQNYGTDLSVNIAGRFNMDYPDTDVRVIFDEDEEEFKIIFDIDVTDIDEVDTFLYENEIIPTITDKQTGETYNVFDYIEDKNNIVNTTHYLMGSRRGK